jgi:hypothetical protein
MTVKLLTIVAMLVLGTQADAQTVYLFTKTSETGFVDATSNRRADSVKDLRKVLMKEGLKLVDDPRAALVIEVLESAPVLTGWQTTIRGGFGQTSSVADKKAMVRVSLTVGDYQTEIVGYNSSTFASPWASAAAAVANQVDQWLRDNRAQVAVILAAASSASRDARSDRIEQHPDDRTEP